MVPLPVVLSTNSTLLPPPPQPYPFVAVFVGGTSGIGTFALEALASHSASQGTLPSKKLRIYIVGRNAAAFETIASECRERSSDAEVRFVKAKDLSLMGDVDGVCEEILRLEGGEGRIDLLVMSQGFLAFDGRQETSEGLDALVSVLYYSRMRFILRLLPLLLTAPPSAPAHIVSVFGPHRDKSSTFFPSDLSLRDPAHYGFMNMGNHVAHLTTFFFESLAKRHEGRLALVHYFPSFVVTSPLDDPKLPWWLRWAWKLLIPFSGLFAVAREECAERVLFLASGRFPPRREGGVGDALKGGKGEEAFEVAVASDGVVGGGAYRVNWNGEIILTGKGYKELREDGMEEKCWEHTMKAFEEIEAGRVFKE